MIKEFDMFERINEESKNKLYKGYMGEANYFVKRYVVRKGRRSEDLQKIRREILCYKKLKGIELPKLLKGSFLKRYLVLEFADFKDVQLSKAVVDDIIKLLDRLADIDASFLGRVTCHYYSNSLARRAKALEQMGVIKNSLAVLNQFKAKHQLIDTFATHFSHGDFHLRNLKYWNGKFTLVDFEHSRRDNQMYDPASVYVDIFHRPEKQYFYNRISRRDGFNKPLFNLMVLRRCIEALFGLKDNPNDQQFKNAKVILRN